jgi:hypothetical protein
MHALGLQPVHHAGIEWQRQLGGRVWVEPAAGVFRKGRAFLEGAHRHPEPRASGDAAATKLVMEDSAY